MKYLLLKHYRGAPTPAGAAETMEHWTPEEVDAHIQYMRDFAVRLQKTGEFVDERALSPKGWLIAAAWRKFLDATRADISRRRRELAAAMEPASALEPQRDDSLWLTAATSTWRPKPAVSVANSSRSPTIRKWRGCCR